MDERRRWREEQAGVGGWVTRSTPCSRCSSALSVEHVDLRPDVCDASADLIPRPLDCLLPRFALRLSRLLLLPAPPHHLLLLVPLQPALEEGVLLAPHEGHDEGALLLLCGLGGLACALLSSAHADIGHLHALDQSASSGEAVCVGVGGGGEEGDVALQTLEEFGLELVLRGRRHEEGGGEDGGRVAPLALQGGPLLQQLQTTRRGGQHPTGQPLRVGSAQPRQIGQVILTVLQNLREGKTQREREKVRTTNSPWTVMGWGRVGR